MLMTRSRSVNEIGPGTPQADLTATTVTFLASFDSSLSSDARESVTSGAPRLGHMSLLHMDCAHDTVPRAAD